MWKDVIFALRTLRRNPLFTIFATLSLALGIGAATSIFSLLDQVLLRMLPVRDPGRMVLFHREYAPSGSSSSDNFESVFSYPMYREMRDRDPAFSGVIARSSGRIALSHRGATEAATVELVSGNFFDTLGVPAAVGRVLTGEDDGNPGAHPVAVLGHSYWVSRFGSDPAIVNQSVTVNGHGFAVIGIAAAGFNGIVPGSTPDLYVPIAMLQAVQPTSDVKILDDSSTHWLNVFGRMKEGLELSQVQAATDVVYRSAVEAEWTRSKRSGGGRERDQFLNHKVEVRLASQGINSLRREWEKPLLAVMAMGGLLLLITCANVAGLMLARAAGRQREIAVRLSLGATRARLIRQLVIEGLVLFVAASGCGLLAAWWGSAALIRILPNDLAGNWLTATIDLRLLAFNTVLSVVCGLLFGIIPALQATGPNLAATLKDQAAQVASGSAARLRKIMVTAQVAFSLTLLVVAGLFSESLFRLMKVDLGFRAERLLTLSVDATPSRPDRAGANMFYRDLLTRLGSIGGVLSAGASHAGPFSNSTSSSNITVEGYRAADNEATDSEREEVSPGFFRSLGIPFRAGREFNDADDAGAPKVVVVNEAFVKHYLHGTNPIGRRLMFGASNHPVLDRQIVGVVADSHKGVRERPAETIYMPYAQWDKPDRLVFYVRANGDETRLGPALQRLVRTLDANVAVGDPKPMTVLIANSIYTDRLIAGLSAAFGILATLMAAIGLYGVIGYAVARRTREIGLRMALGALPGDVLRLILGEAALMVAIGVVLGAGGGLALGRFAQSQLFGIQPADPLLFAGSITVIALVTVAAACVPAWRAARIDPVSALRNE